MNAQANVVLTQVELDAVTAVSRGGVGQEKRMVLMTDVLWAAGLRSQHLVVRTKNNAAPHALLDEQAKLKAAIVAGFDANVRKLLAREDTKGLSDAQKLQRRAWQQRIGADYARIQKHIASREAKAPAKAKTLSQAARAQIEALIKRLQAAENLPAELRQPEAIKHLTAALACFPASK